MKKRLFNVIMAIFAAVVVMIIGFIFVSSFYNSTLFTIELIVGSVIVILCVVSFVIVYRGIHEYFISAAKSIDCIDEKNLNDLGLSCVSVDKRGEIVWYNKKFLGQVLKGRDVYGIDLSVLLSSKTIAVLEENGSATAKYNEKTFSIYEAECTSDFKGQKLYFFIDESDKEIFRQKYESARMIVLFIHIDGLDMLLKGVLESRKNEIMGVIERQIEELNKEANGYILKVSSDKYFLITENNNYNKLLNDKFSILKKIRQLEFGDNGSITLSIGVGVEGESVSKSVELANNALDMALGRGGDQAVVNHNGKFEFFGGVSEAKQLNTAVRARLVAQTLKKLILGSENVLIMGHKYSDMDSFGSAYSLYVATKKLGKPVNIVCDHNSSLAYSLIRYTATFEPDDYIISADEAMQRINRKTLLIVVDTLRPSFLEEKSIYEKSSAVVVIDHHRKTVDFIDNALLFYHDTSASSACELICGILRYLNDGVVEKQQANALLAGIMLDTKNFVLRTTARTFEASAFAREKGADPVAVKEFFDETIDTYSLKSKIVSAAKIKKNIAISFCDEDNENSRVAASQAADELLTIKGVQASFVCFKSSGKMNVSARSFGKVNVQVVMERLGGGGHATMAAAQLDCSSFADCFNLILGAIDKE